MATTNVRLPRTHLRALKRMAVERDMSLSRLFREVIDEFLHRETRALSPSTYRSDPLFELGNQPGRSGLGDLAEDHDRYLHDSR